jgi:hypothetical protein
MENLQIDKTAYFTVFNNAYLDRAIVLAESLFEKNSVRLKIYLFEKNLPSLNKDISIFCEIILINEINFDRINELAFKYDVVEFTTSLKPYISLFLLEKYKKVIFFDPDIYVLDSTKEIEDLLDDQDLLLTSHFNIPELNDVENPDLGMMRFGSFNLGFFAVKNSINGKAFLKWWNNKCLDQCFFETQFGISTDQKWVSIANAFFDFLYIIRNPGYNVAYWNLFEREITFSNNKYFANNHNITFFHFSTYDTEKSSNITKRIIIKDEYISSALLQLSNEYYTKLKNYKSIINSSEKKYSYNYFSNGKFISPTLRRAYASKINFFTNEQDPFLYNSEVYKFAKRNNLLTKKDKFLLHGYDKIESNKTFFYILNKLLKVSLLILGPNKFFNLSRLFVYLSSYNRNKSLWK